MNNTIGKEFIETAIKRMVYYKKLAEKTFDQLSDKDFHFAPNGTSNSIAMIIQHMAGNMLSRWTNFLTEDGEKEWRQRDDEFEAHDYSKAQLIELWEKGWNCFLGALESLREEDLLKNDYHPAGAFDGYRCGKQATGPLPASCGADHLCGQDREGCRLEMFIHTQRRI